MSTVVGSVTTRNFSSVRLVFSDTAQKVDFGDCYLVLDDQAYAKYYHKATTMFVTTEVTDSTVPGYTGSVIDISDILTFATVWLFRRRKIVSYIS